MRITRIEKVDVVGPHSLRLWFNDGLQKCVHVLPLLRGPIFQPLLDPSCFARVHLDPVAGTVVWPNGADLAPEALHDLPEQDPSVPPRAAEGSQPTQRKARGG